MFFNKSEQTHSLTSEALKSTQRAANVAVDSLAGAVHDIRQHASPLIDRAAEQMSGLAHRGVDRVRDTSQQLRDKALHASDSTVNYIRDEPVKSVLLAAAAGAALMALVSLLSSSRNHR